MYQSILFFDRESGDKIDLQKNLYFQEELYRDLNLNQMIESVTIGEQKEFIKKVLETPLTNTNEIYYRQEIFKDFEQ